MHVILRRSYFCKQNLDVAWIYYSNDNICEHVAHEVFK